MFIHLLDTLNLPSGHQSLCLSLCSISEWISRKPGYLEDQLEDIVRNVEAASAGLLDQVEGLGKLEGLGLVTVNLEFERAHCQSLYIPARGGMLVFDHYVSSPLAI